MDWPYDETIEHPGISGSIEWILEAVLRLVASFEMESRDEEDDVHGLDFDDLETQFKGSSAILREAEFVYERYRRRYVEQLRRIPYKQYLQRGTGECSGAPP